MSTRKSVRVCLLVLAMWACQEDGVTLPANEAGPGQEMGPSPEGGVNDGGPQGDGRAANRPPDVVVPRVDCSAYEYRGTVYDCEALDRCDPQRDFTAQLACCECDPLYCNADPSCDEADMGPAPPDPDDGVAPPPAPPPPRPPPRAESCLQCHIGA